MTTNSMKTVRDCKETAIDFLRLVVAGQVRAAFRKHIGPDFRHHNPFFRGDAGGLQTAMEADAAQFPNKVLEIQHVFLEGDLVAVHSRVRMAPGGPDWALVHIFRFQGGRVVELWDIGQAAPEHSPNRHGMF